MRTWLILPLIPFVAVVYASDQIQAQTPQPELKAYRSDPFRVFYHLDGPDAVESADANANRVPDQVEDALTQIRAAHLLFVRILEFPDPLVGARFGEASFVDIRFRRKHAVQGNGKAYDELQRYQRAGDPPGTLCLGIAISTSVKPASNDTPAHEYFHLIQYGATYFKNRWFTEGTARWSEQPFRSDVRPPARRLGTWPMSPEQREVLVTMAYDAAAYFWQPLAFAHDPDGAIPTSELLEQLLAMTYVNGSRVIKDPHLPGSKLVRQVLAELGVKDDVAFRELGYEKWSEENQRSAKNDAYLFSGIEMVVSRNAGTQSK